MLMKLMVTEKKDSALLDRTQLQGVIDFEGATPSNNDVAMAIAKELKTDVSLVVVKSVKTRFSQQKADFLALGYKTAEARQKMEKMTKHLKKKIAEAKEAKKGE